MPPEEKPARRSAPPPPAVHEPNRRAFLVYSLAMLMMWTVGLSLFPQSVPHQLLGMVGAWAAATAGGVVFRLRRDGRGWVGPFARRAVPLAAAVAAVGLAAWYGAPSLGPHVATYVQDLAPGFLVAILMVGTGRILFPIHMPRPAP